MILKKVLHIAGFLLGASLALSSIAQQAPLTVYPAAGQYLEGEKFDIAINVGPQIYLPDPMLIGSLNNPVPLKAYINDVDATAWFNECLQDFSTETGNRLLLCRSLDYSPFSLGNNHVKFVVGGYGTAFTVEADYNFLPNPRKPKTLPFRFVIQGKSMNTPTGINVLFNDRLFITATGTVNTWPSSPGYAAGYKGSVICATNSTCLLPGAPLGALLVKVGQYGRWVYVGGASSFIADRPGELIFAVNDKTELATISDNIGSFEVTISR